MTMIERLIVTKERLFVELWVLYVVVVELRYNKDAKNQGPFQGFHLFHWWRDFELLGYTEAV